MKLSKSERSNELTGELEGLMIGEIEGFCLMEWNVESIVETVKRCKTVFEV